MKHGSLFSGIGGFDLAAESMGWENVFHCEWMPFPRKVLSHYWPQATSYHDITTTDFTVHRGQIDILTGGFPCQPYSAAGKRKGKDDDRHLWPHMLRCIREVRPRWVVGENVFGLVTWNAGMVFEEVCADLESEGYSVQPFVLPAAAVNAPHRRDRVWFVAYHDGELHGDIAQGQSRHDASVQGAPSERIVANASGKRTRDERIQSDVAIGTIFNDIGDDRDATDAQSAGSQGECKHRSWEVQPHGRSGRAIQTNFEDFPTVAPICSGDDGLPHELDGITFPKWRAESIKGYGNAIVPQVAMQIFRAIEQYEQQ
jgi:DNA (cytosine-5)-methyltransferase 1